MDLQNCFFYYSLFQMNLQYCNCKGWLALKIKTQYNIVQYSTCFSAGQEGVLCSNWLCSSVPEQTRSETTGCSLIRYQLLSPYWCVEQVTAVESKLSCSPMLYISRYYATSQVHDFFADYPFHHNDLTFVLTSLTGPTQEEAFNPLFICFYLLVQHFTSPSDQESELRFSRHVKCWERQSIKNEA